VHTLQDNGPGRHQRRGAVTVFFLISLPLMIGLAALSVDTGYLWVARAELQNAADASALAGASAYSTDAGLKHDWASVTQIARTRAKSVALKNPVLRKGLVLADDDISLGKHDFDVPTGPMLTETPWNAVQVTARRTDASANGPVPLFFARFFGRFTKDIIASARAVLDCRASGFDLRRGINVLPFTIPEQVYYKYAKYGPDLYSYNSGVVGGADGVREVDMFPCKNQAPGNFGILDMGRIGDGASDITAQILAGVSPAELQAAFGTTNLVFYDETHTPETGPKLYPVSGTTGMKTSIGKALQLRIGQVYGFFLNRGAVDSGTNAVYSISGIVFCRIMAVDLAGGCHPTCGLIDPTSGEIHTCGLLVQPVPFESSWVITDPNAPPTDFMVGRISLVQ
jgi:hypothetical protein